jgi:hypothetical protein
LGAMITGMGIFIGCGYGFEMGIGVSTLQCCPKLITGL